jgi:hypothetical protein
VPPNVKFEIDDVECPWVYEMPFDFIFCRYMTGSITDWPKLVERVHECVKSIPQRPDLSDMRGWIDWLTR